MSSLLSSFMCNGWKDHSLMTGDGAGCPNKYFVCGRIVYDQYTDVYDHDCNLNETVTKLRINKQCRIGMHMNLATRLPVRVSTNPNFRDDQNKSLTGCKQKYLEYVCQFHQFVKDDNNSSTSPPVVAIKYPKRIRKPTARLIDNQLN